MRRCLGSTKSEGTRFVQTRKIICYFDFVIRQDYNWYKDLRLSRFGFVTQLTEKRIRVRTRQWFADARHS